MVPNNLLHLIHIFVRKNLLPATRLINKGVVVEGTLIIVEYLVTTAMANIVSPEDIRFEERNTVYALLMQSEVVGALNSGLLRSLMV